MSISENKNNVCAVIPFFNEKSTLNKIVTETINYVDLLILVNDGSTDNWQSEILKSEKIILISNENNLGKGAALKLGFLKSIELKTLITITLDADLQHDPKQITNFLNNIENYDCIIGKREISKTKMPIHRRLSNYLTSKLLSMKTGTEILDSQSGFRAFKTNILENILPQFTGFEAESEMIVKLCKQKYKLGFILIPTIYGNDNSKMKAIPTILGFIKVLLKT
ncbi:MAG: glycosyltransferase family 2 protein [Ignavibacteriae bacterium]|nr:glycosyltransferase family 2 protein [Ignavibacteriota bacterium]